MGDMLRYVPSIVIAGFTMLLAACVGPGQPTPPFQGPVPVPIPWGAPFQECEHTILSGVRYNRVIPQAGVWSYEWQLTTVTGPVWITGPSPYPYQVGDTFRFDSYFPVRIIWAPSSAPGTQ